MALSNQLVKFSEIPPYQSLITRGLTQTIGDMSLLANSHVPVKSPYPKRCSYCRHGYNTSDRLTTTFKYSFCDVPLTSDCVGNFILSMDRLPREGCLRNNRIHCMARASLLLDLSNCFNSNNLHWKMLNIKYFLFWARKIPMVILY